MTVLIWQLKDLIFFRAITASYNARAVRQPCQIMNGNSRASDNCWLSVTQQVQERTDRRSHEYFCKDNSYSIRCVINDCVALVLTHSKDFRKGYKWGGIGFKTRRESNLYPNYIEDWRVNTVKVEVGENDKPFIGKKIC